MVGRDSVEPAHHWGRSRDATPGPSRQTGRAVFPHPAFQSARLLLGGDWPFLCPEPSQAQESEFGKVAVAPAVMIGPSSPPLAAAPLAQDRAQPSTDPAVHRSEEH